MSRSRKMSVLGKNDELNLPPDTNRLIYGVEIKGRIRNLNFIDCCCLGFTKLGILRENTHFVSIGDVELIDGIHTSLSKLQQACASVRTIGEEKIVVEEEGESDELDDTISTVEKVSEKHFRCVEGKGYEMIISTKDLSQRDVRYIFLLVRTEKTLEELNIEQIVTYWHDKDKNSKVAINTVNLLKAEHKTIGMSKGLIQCLLYRNEESSVWKIKALNKGLKSGSDGIGHISAELMKPEFFPDNDVVIGAKLKYFQKLVEQANSIPLHNVEIKHYCVFKAKMNDIPKLDVFGLSDPYFLILKKNNEEVFKSEVIYKTLNPVYNREMFVFCDNFFGANEVFTVKVYDWDKLKSDDYAGEFKFCPAKALKKSNHKYEIIDPSKKKKKKYKNSGTFQFTSIVKKAHVVRSLNPKHSKLMREIKGFWRR